ncbi:hypothetical protein ZWY2020_008002 [Hordeum vulgare]|nr:hypothetical protein ZWY2020_008002 [Hordeum vulgare]
MRSRRRFQLAAAAAAPARFPPLSVVAATPTPLVPPPPPLPPSPASRHPPLVVAIAAADASQEASRPHLTRLEFGVCDGPMRKKCKLTVLLMGGTNNPIVLTLASLFKLTFSYNKKEDVDSYSSVSKILPIIALKGRFCFLYSHLTE